MFSIIFCVVVWEQGVSKYGGDEWKEGVRAFFAVNVRLRKCHWIGLLLCALSHRMALGGVRGDLWLWRIKRRVYKMHIVDVFATWLLGPRIFNIDIFLGNIKKAFDQGVLVLLIPKKNWLSKLFHYITLNLFFCILIYNFKYFTS